MKPEPVNLGKYRHYKGNYYEVLGVAVHSETKEELVIYRALYNSKKYGDNALWARPRSLFFGDVESKGRKVKRFEFVGKSRF